MALNLVQGVIGIKKNSMSFTLFGKREKKLNEKKNRR